MCVRACKAHQLQTIVKSHMVTTLTVKTEYKAKAFRICISALAYLKGYVRCARAVSRSISW